MNYLARFKALQALGQSSSSTPFEAFEGWSEGPFLGSAAQDVKPHIQPSERRGKGRSFKSTNPNRWIRARNGPVEAPSKASKGPEEWRAGLNRLVPVPAPKGLYSSEWTEAIKRAVSFCDNWGDQALSCGWTARELFGMHPSAPLARLDGLGVAFMGTDAKVVGVEPGIVRLCHPTGSIRIARPPANPQQPAWQGPWSVNAN